MTLCTLCFANFGLKYEASLLAQARPGHVCPTCHKSGGGPLDRDSAGALMHNFFVRGSIPPEVSGPAPLFEFNSHRQHGEVSFGTELDADLERLSKYLDVGLFHYGPALWRIGYTEHYQQLSGHLEDGAAAADGKERAQVWEQVLSRCSTRRIDPGSEIFRARVGAELVAAVPASFDAPPPGIAGNGRYESPDLPMLYAAEDVETCLHESRVTLSDWIAIGTLEPVRSLQVLDLSHVDDSDAKTPFEAIGILLDKLAFSGSHEYALCREMAREIHRRGFDGFVYTSYFAQAHSRRLQNVALFGRPVAEGKLALKSVNRVRLRQVSYAYCFGPHNDRNLPIDDEEIRALSRKALSGSINIREFSDALNSIVERRSSGPR